MGMVQHYTGAVTLRVAGTLYMYTQKFTIPRRQPMTETEFMQEVLAEVKRARAAFPSNEHVAHALTEEAGEAIKALMDEGTDAVVAECVQAAAMALRVALEGDPTLDGLREDRGLDKHPAPPKPKYVTKRADEIRPGDVMAPGGVVTQTRHTRDYVTLYYENGTKGGPWPKAAILGLLS